MTRTVIQETHLYYPAVAVELAYLVKAHLELLLALVILNQTVLQVVVVDQVAQKEMTEGLVLIKLAFLIQKAKAVFTAEVAEVAVILFTQEAVVEL
jgi:hypothetical protein